MISFAAWGCLAILCVCAWKLYQRRALRSLSWSPKLDTFQLARKCEAYLRLYGIAATRLNPQHKEGPRTAEGPVNLRVTREQFNNRLPLIKIICREQTMRLGETLFKDIGERRSRNNDWKSLVIVLRSTPMEPAEAHLAETYRVGVLAIAELRDFAMALRAIANGAPPNFTSKSPTLVRALETGSIGPL